MTTQNDAEKEIENVVLTLTLSPTGTLKLNVIPHEVSGFQLQSWQVLGMLETATQMVKNRYLLDE